MASASVWIMVGLTVLIGAGLLIGLWRVWASIHQERHGLRDLD